MYLFRGEGPYLGEVASGVEKEVRVQRLEKCDACGGTGANSTVWVGLFCGRLRADGMTRTAMSRKPRFR